jgi:hypothetical protein
MMSRPVHQHVVRKTEAREKFVGKTDKTQLKTERQPRVRLLRLCLVPKNVQQHKPAGLHSFADKDLENAKAKDTQGNQKEVPGYREWEGKASPQWHQSPAGSSVCQT